VAAAIESVVKCKRIGVAVAGLEVPHVHIHLIPMDSMEDLNFHNPKLKFTPEEFREIAAKINRKVIP
jgi:histidine triad (HIT) family protein